MEELVVFCGFVICCVLCYYVGRITKEDEFKNERLNNIRRVDNIIARAGKHYDKLHAKDKL